MRIRNAQLAALTDEVEKRFAIRLRIHILKYHADACYEVPDEQLWKRVRLGIKKAKKLGLVWQSSIACFVGLMFEFGPGFSEHPLIKNAFSSHPADAALFWAVQTLTDGQWDQIETDVAKTWHV